MGKGKKSKSSTNSKSKSKPKISKSNSQRRSTKYNQSHSKTNSNGALSTLYIIVAFSFAIVAFILGRAPLTSNFPILEQFYVYLPSSVTNFSNYLLYLFNLQHLAHSDSNDYNTFSKSNIFDSNNDNNIDAMNSSHPLVQPLTKNKLDIDPIIMATAYFDDSVKNENTQECDLENWLMRNNVEFEGYHLLCVTKSNDNGNDRLIKYFRNGIYNEQTSKQYISDLKSFKSLRFELEKVLKIDRTDSRRLEIKNEKDRWLKWSMFDTYGREIIKTNYESLFYGIILIFEIGLFQYPPIEIGFERKVSVRNMNPDSVEYQEYLEMNLTTLSIFPVVLQVSGFIAYEYCDYIISDSSLHMKRSTVSHMHNTKGDSNQWRTSSTHWLKSSDSIVNIIDKQTSSLTHLPLTHQENVQVLRYFEGEQYDSHWDYFDPTLYQGTNMQEKIRGGRNRFLTLFWYLSDVKDGGWTYFPMSGNLPRPTSFKLKKIEDCEKGGLKVTPKKGNAIIFYSMKPSGHVDPLSLHGACPVGHNQTKWGANKWIWTKEVNLRY